MISIGEIQLARITAEEIVRLDAYGGCVAAVEQSEVLVFGTAVGEEIVIEGGVAELRRAGVVVEIRAGEEEGVLSLVELQDAVGDRVVSQLGDGVAPAGEGELRRAAVGGAGAAGEGVGGVDDCAAGEGAVAVGVGGGGGGGGLGVRRREESGGECDEEMIGKRERHFYEEGESE